MGPTCLQQESVENQAEEEARGTRQPHARVRTVAPPATSLKGGSPCRAASGTRSDSWTRRAKVLEELLTRRRLPRVTCLRPARHSSSSSSTQKQAAERGLHQIEVAQPAVGMRPLALARAGRGGRTEPLFGASGRDGCRLAGGSHQVAQGHWSTASHAAFGLA